MYIIGGTVTVTDTNIYSNNAADVQLVFGTFLALSSYAPGGRNFPELTKCEHLPFWQGGGIYIEGGTVTVMDTNIYSNTADRVCACLWNFPCTFFLRPRRKKLP